MQKAFEVTIEGTVQGVGFRPFLARLANSLGLAGSVENRESGVRLIVFCQEEELDLFLKRLERERPVPSRIEVINVLQLDLPGNGQESFSIMSSKKEGTNTALIPPDIAICNSCIGETLSEDNRRNLYPFTSCAECGPRFSITTALPYDRENTSMKSYELCGPCLEEYTNREDRRYHAQTNCCGDCGPRYELVESMTGRKFHEYPIEKAIEVIANNSVIALKGIGGFSLVCKPEIAACERLRLLKKRPQKPFALMARNVDAIRAFAHVDRTEEEALLSAARPIVLLKLKSAQWKESVAPGLDRIGVMLPYMGVHYLFLRKFPLLVVTSGNASGEMLCATHQEAFTKLRTFCDYFLFHDRDIVNRCDDSLVKIVRNKQLLMRKSRGFIPEHIAIAARSKETVLTTGADMKGSFGFSRNGAFIGSQYLGDLAYKMNQDHFREMIRRYRKLFDMEPVAVVSDAHPGYFSKLLGEEYAEETGIPQYFLQHHAAHVYSVMAERDLCECIGVSFDGTGYGEDGQVWGGEFFYFRGSEYKRFAHLRYVPMPGGEASARFPSVMAGSYLEDSGFTVDDKTRLMCKHAPAMTSSAGRLFDAVASVLGVCDENTYEGEAAMKLEAVSRQSDEVLPWGLNTEEETWKIDLRKTMSSLISRIGKDPASILASAFHNTLADIVLKTCLCQAERSNLKVACLSGGVFQNKLLLERCIELLGDNGFSVYFNERVSPNDEGIALGQAYWYELRM